MSYEICKSIVFSIPNKEVFITSRCNNVSPSVYERWQPKDWDKMYKEEGLEKTLCSIGESIWEGNLQLVNGKGSKIVELYKKALKQIPKGFHWSSVLADTMGEFLGKAVVKYLDNSNASLNKEVEELITLRNSKEYILKAAESGVCIIDYVDNLELAQDKEFVMKLVELCGERAGFEIPMYFKNDKDVALLALKKNGCSYRSLGHEMLKDKEVIEKAFSYNEERHYNEHLIDLIPESVLKNGEEWDIDYICHLLEICPVMHLERMKELVKIRKIALKWCETGKYCLSNLHYIETEFLKEPEFQNTLFSRNDVNVEELKKRFMKRNIYI